MSKPLEDLFWCLQSPSLIAKDFQPGTLTDFACIDQVDTQALLEAIPHDLLHTKLLQHLSHNKSHFLGPYFEQLWSFYLQTHPRYELLASNLQVHQDKKTIGEFDFLIHDKQTQQHIHQELAIKFYLGHEEQGQAYWIGPQTVDRFDKKMAHLLKHQLLLSRQTAAKKALEELGIQSVSTQLIMKGYLFQPRHLAPVALQAYANPKHATGSWLPFSVFKQRITQGEFDLNTWQILNKKEWLSREAHLDPERFLTSHHILQHIEADRPTLLSRIEQSEGQAEETEKLFIVSDHWPHLAKASPAL